MNRLWAPWRKTYLRPGKGGKEKGCVFCRLLSEKQDVKNYILKRTPYSFALLNLYPYNNGHVMIVPIRHVDSIHVLSTKEKLDWLDLYEEVRLALKSKLKPHGFNVGMNLGKVGGAGIPHHMHLHVVPRWKGDANFMPVIGETKVISESLDSVYHHLTSWMRSKRKRKKTK